MHQFGQAHRPFVNKTGPPLFSNKPFIVQSKTQKFHKDNQHSLGNGSAWQTRSTSPAPLVLVYLCVKSAWFHLPVHDAQAGVEDDEDDEFFVEQLVDAAPPAQKQVGEGTQTSIGHPA